ncbi:MAG TPA: hypothetical protein VFH95_09710 [Candidatus Kapabacteria bacterium]|nr:hypothetical protein [Candidatus Kapabacteria bacterium]
MPEHRECLERAVVKPKMGSTFTDSASTKDTTLANKPGQLVTYTLVDTTRTLAGKSGVYVFDNNLDTLYQYYESNGDLSIYVDFSAAGYDAGQEWVTFPFASQTTANITTFSKLVVDTVTISGSVQGSGTGTDIVSGHSLSVEKATLTSQAKSMLVGTIPATVLLHYAPSIGLVTYQDFTEQGRLFGTSISGGTTNYLTSYSLK